MDLRLKKIETVISMLKGRRTVKSVILDDFLYKECDYIEGARIPQPDATFNRFINGMHWASTPDSHCLFFKRVPGIEVPAVGEETRLSIETDLDGWNVYNPQFICFVNGERIQSFDTNHRSAPINAVSGFDLSVYAYSGSLGKHLPFICRLDYISLPIEKLYYDMLVLNELLSIAGEESKEYADIRRALLDACDRLDLRDIPICDFLPSVEQAQAVIDSYTANVPSGRGTVVCVGHSHIDVAWMWTLAQTREKICRTVSTVLSLMERYPDFIFMESQPQLYKYLKEEAPELYAKVKERIAEGRWEADGAMWVEADCNLTSGESLVRQIIHGKRFFSEELGVDSRILWLPDVFGYSAALPQLCAKSGIDAFVTSKISWNDTDRMPFDAFSWRGIDGTSVFTYFLTAQDKVRGRESANYTTYVATTDPKCVAGCFDRFTQKDLTDEVLLTYGWGDGGGGPTAQMLEKKQRLEKFSPGCPTVRDGKMGDFIRGIKERAEQSGNLPEWDGELYLEYHRGTYTSVAEVKKNNRRAEFELLYAELLSCIADKFCGLSYPDSKIYSLWELLLLNQFHDILPGSSIPQVYQDSANQFKTLFAELNTITARATAQISNSIDSKGGLLVFNPHSFVAEGCVRCENRSFYVSNIPANGYAVVQYEKRTPRTVSGNGLAENDYYRIEFAEDFTIRRLYSKKLRREVLLGCGNRLVAYEDLPHNYSCWNVEAYHKDKCYYIDDVREAKAISDGERSGYRIVRRFMSSVITQDIWLYDNSPRIDFCTEVDWNEKDLLLKAEFDVAVRSDHAVYDVQFGQVSRPTHTNTSWDAAKFEVCGQKYADLSDYGFGVALLNDCKYGYDIHGSRMALSLIKCSPYTNEYYDRRHHSFTYALLPHEGDYRAAGVIKEAYLLNQPLVATQIKAGNGSMPDRFSFISCSEENIIIEVVKKAYDGRGIIVRAFEAFDMESSCVFTLCEKAAKVCECDLLENDLEGFEKKVSAFKAEFAPREIKTFRIVFDRKEDK